jgi:hypothetical protein
MNFATVANSLAAWLLLAGVTSSASAQAPSSTGVDSGSSIRLSDVEIGLVTGGGGGGCVGRCNIYRITIRGDGVITREDIGTPPRADTLKRTVDVGEVVALVNEFLRVRFFDALDRYESVMFVERKGDLLLLRGRGSIDGGTANVTMRLGSRTRTVVLSENFPIELGGLRDRILGIGGPQSWPAR